LAIVLACAGAMIAGCGTSRTPVPNAAVPAAPNGYVGVGFPHVGIRFLFPTNWTRLNFGLPLDATISSGPAVVALWRYARSGPQPSDRLELAQARNRLISAARARDRTLVVIRSKLTRIDGAPTIVLDATETNSGRPQRVRSIHIFVRGGEIVLDEYAPPNLFHTVDHDVFSPLNRSVVLHGTRASRA